MHVASLHVFPVKGLKGCSPDRATVEPWGLAGDRRWMIVDSAGRFITQRQNPGLATLMAIAGTDALTLVAVSGSRIDVPYPDRHAECLPVTVWRDVVAARDGGAAASAFLAPVLGVPCRLVFMDDPAEARPADPDFARPGDRVSFADGFPLLLTTSASLADLNTRLAQPVPMNRFRPNLVVAGTEPWAEDGWRHLRVGDVPFEIVKPCARCVVTTVDQDTGIKSEDQEPLRTLQRFRRDARGQVLFGQNLVPRGTGTDPRRRPGRDSDLNVDQARCSASPSSVKAASAKACMLDHRSPDPVATVCRSSCRPNTATQLCPGGSP